MRHLYLCLTLFAGLAQAGDGKLRLTGGDSSIDGAAGGGLTPWAVIGSHATEGQTGATAFATRLTTGNYAFSAYGLALAHDDRFELSLARQDLDAGDNLAPLGLRGLHLRQDILAAKLRLFGEAVLDADTWAPQVALGVEHKRAHAGALAPTLFGPLGARRAGTDVYVSATKLLLGPGLVWNLTLRASRAQQNGLLGQDRAWRVLPEVSLAKLLSRSLAVGVEYRVKPNPLNDSILGPGALREDDWWDAFIAWAPAKSVSFTAAWVNLGRIAPAVQPRRQAGAYLSAQLAF